MLGMDLQVGDMIEYRAPEGGWTRQLIFTGLDEAGKPVFAPVNADPHE